MQTSSASLIPIKSPRDLLALVPFVIGFHPSESVVVLTIDSVSGRMGPIARIDLAEFVETGRDESGDPKLSEPDPIGALRGTLHKERVDTVVVAIYATDTKCMTSTTSPATTDIELMSEAAREIVKPIFAALSTVVSAVSAWLVTPFSYLDLYCVDTSCCPGEGRPIAELDGSSVGAQMVYSGYTIASSRSELARISYVDQRERRAAGQAARAWERSRIKSIANEQREGEGQRAWRRACLALWRDAIDHYRCGQSVTRSTLGRLSAALDDGMVRDAIIIDLIPSQNGESCGSDPALNALEYPAGVEVGAAVESLLDADRPAIPRRDTLSPAVCLLTDVAASARKNHRAPALSLLSWLAWWLGEGPRACVLIELALIDQPMYTLAKLLNSMLTHALAPGWFHAGNTAPAHEDAVAE